jgi:hypothetical protein
MAEQQSTRFTVAMVDVERTILEEIADRRLTRDDVAATYAFGLRDEMTTVDWQKVNHAILDRWSLNALTYIKKRAWGLLEGKA